MPRAWRAGVAMACATFVAGAQTPETRQWPRASTLDAHRQEVACGKVLRDLYEWLVTEDARGRLIPGMAQHWSM